MSSMPPSRAEAMGVSPMRSRETVRVFDGTAVPAGNSAIGTIGAYEAGEETRSPCRSCRGNTGRGRAGRLRTLVVSCEAPPHGRTRLIPSAIEDGPGSIELQGACP